MENTLAALDIAARLNDGQTYTNHPSHDFTGFDGRCMNCDCRRFGRHAPHQCDAAPTSTWDAVKASLVTMPN